MIRIPDGVTATAMSHMYLCERLTSGVLATQVLTVRVNKIWRKSFTL